MSDPILNQNEIDALLNGINGVESPLEPLPSPGETRSYDLGKEMRIVRGRMPTLEMINERFARLFRLSLYGVLRRQAEVAAAAVQLKKFNEYVHTLHLPTSLNMVRFNPLRGTSLIVVDPKLVFAIVDTAFGGNGRHANIEGREFTATENRIIRTVLDRVFSDLQQAWAHVHPIEIEYLNTEMNPHFAGIVSPTEVVVITAFRIDIEGHGGELHVTMPYSMVEPLRDVLDSGVQSDRADRDDRWTNALHDEVLDAAVEMRAMLGEGQISLSNLLDMQVGDVIPFDFDGRAVLHADELPLFKGLLGASRGMCAVQLQGNARPRRAQGASPLAQLQARSKLPT
ncbi:MAG: flagellar motor switch protein FliM [Steroidobacteraceae bacterium]|nr:flagellar motor switch protein FliM [Nevskiaceae bacterium]MCP5339102.1 flagellar motor switch protein FliM [Nevskiaceae bacterium]MCP5360011.1 flagellar motor switch protein FliM [Nevskiaceae bacterium]MCP5466941.1 flagellar motor switch protein FliM [Nevskiaceae bacterium]MCP5472169.1 flagellar motor switch protein FliM [Nevskiaceae bacterium]